MDDDLEPYGYAGDDEYGDDGYAYGAASYSYEGDDGDESYVSYGAEYHERSRVSQKLKANRVKNEND